MKTMGARLVDPDRWRAWDEFVDASRAGSFMQLSWWARFREPIGFDHFGVTLKHHGAIVGGALVAKRRFAPGRCFYYIQDGPVLPDDETFAGQVFEAILERIEQHRAAETERVSHLRIEPRWQRRPDFARGFSAPDFRDVYREPRRTLWLDLRLSDDALLAQMKPKGRYNIRVAQRHGVAVREDNSEQGLADFQRIYRQTTARHGIGKKPPSYFRAFVAAASPPASLLFAEYRGRRIATALVVRCGRRATYFYGGSLVLYRRVMAPYLLQFEAARSARAAGCEWYDLWGVAPPDEPEHRWQQISEFKRKFGGVELVFVPTLDLVYDAAAYDRFKGVQRAEARRPPAARSPRAAPPGGRSTAAPPLHMQAASAETE